MRAKARRRFTGTVLALALLAGGGACSGDDAADPDPVGAPDTAPVHEDDTADARNVIIIVGDGMGIAHRELIRLTTVGRDGGLAMDDLAHQGWTRTDPADPTHAVTDSAAAATALATGTATVNGAIAVDPAGNPVTTLLEHAAEEDRATGLVTTSRVTDATPAAFGAHVRDRSEEAEIARQYLEETQVDVILGGGGDVWQGSDDEAVLLDRAEELGYQSVDDADGLGSLTDAMVLGLFAGEAMFTAEDDAEAVYDPAVPLPVMAQVALDILAQDPGGFFLVIEEEGIDAMAHANNAEEMIDAGRALDETVALAREFAEADGQTLLVVVADHETGGLALESVDEDLDPGEQRSPETGPFTVAGTDLLFDVQWTSGGHTAAATPASAEGPGAEQMVGVRENTDIHDLVLAAMTR